MAAVWGYARVSREDQALALQLDALGAAGVPSANVVQEKESGARQRPVFDALLKKLNTGDSLVAWKVDRLGRDALAALTVARDLDARGVRIVITTLGVDSSTPAGRMVFGVLAQLAEFERATLIERTNAGLAATLDSEFHSSVPSIRVDAPAPRFTSAAADAAVEPLSAISTAS